MEDILVSFVLPVCICVVLPVFIVWLAMREKQNEANKKAEIMLKAIESGSTIDADFFKPQTVKKSIKEKLLGRLTAACVTGFLGVAFLLGGLAFNWKLNFGPVMPLPLLGSILLAVGISLLVAYLVGKKMLASEIEAEEKALKD
ncbi:MAG: hypothetical protein IKX67_05035 [Bacteroidales bacterium]|nr:hypothetical protein [Bacteroidales bacterium]